MSDVKNEVNRQTGSLAPIRDKDRIMGWGSYLILQPGGYISIGTLTMGSARLDKGLNLMQAFLAVLVRSTILVIGICANDHFSYRSGAPYAAQLKNAYGTEGNIVPVMIHGLPAIVRYELQARLGGSATNQISIAIFGYDNIVLFFLLFQVAQIVLSVKDFHRIKWVENIGGVVIIGAMPYTLSICVTQYWGMIGDELISRRGSWGMPFIVIIIASSGNSTMVMLNAGDYSKELKGSFSIGERGAAYFIAMIPTTVLLGLVGAMAFTAAGTANPINAFSQTIHNKVLLVVALGFILSTRMITNLASSVVLPTYAFMDAFKIKHRTAMILMGIPVVCVCSQILTSDSSAIGLNLSVKIYTAFFGPIFTMLVTSYYILHRGRVEGATLDDLYDDNEVHSGIDRVTIIATAADTVIGLVNVDISPFTATIPIGLVYYFRMKYISSCRRFGKGTSLEK